MKYFAWLVVALVPGLAWANEKALDVGTKVASFTLRDYRGAESSLDQFAAKKVVVLDVRTPEEFAAGHIAGATNVNLNGKDFQERLEKLDKSQAYLVHCAVGMRSARACKKMNELEFKTLYDLKGGLTAWKKDGKPVTKDSAKQP